MTSPETNIARRARKLYREASQHVDPVTAGRLRAARRDALASATSKHSARRWLIPSGAFAMLALVALMVWQPLPHQHHPAAPSVQTAVAIQASADTDNDLPPDADKADPNLYQDLDFYGWLAANDSQPDHR
jgi:hypothetical protein